MTVENLQIHNNLVIVDSVTFSVDFKNSKVISIQEHPMGPCFVCGSARALLTQEQAHKLIQAGVSDLRKKY